MLRLSIEYQFVNKRKICAKMVNGLISFSVKLIEWLSVYRYHVYHIHDTTVFQTTEGLFLFVTNICWTCHTMML